MVTQLEYASAIGSLMSAMHYTRPDIAYVECQMARFISNPSVEHWNVIGKILGYLKRNINKGLFIMIIQQYLKVTLMQVG